MKRTGGRFEAAYPPMSVPPVGKRLQGRGLRPVPLRGAQKQYVQGCVVIGVPDASAIFAHRLVTDGSTDGRATDSTLRRRTTWFDRDDFYPSPGAGGFDKVSQHPERPEVVHQKILWPEIHVFPDARQIFDEQHGYALSPENACDFFGQCSECMFKPAGANLY